MKITGDWLRHKGTVAVMAALEGAGHRALFVGGCIRNAILAEPVGDIDIATDAKPDAVTKAAERAGLRVVPTGLDHGTVTVIAGGRAHEVTTFRRDLATDGRHATIAFSTRLEDDAARRDFTMNAIYADRDGTIVDPLNALADLQSRQLRFVGDPASRIREDYLRILRFFRFYAWYGDPASGPDPDALAACAALQDGLEGLSRERIGAEIRKLLSAPDPAPALSAMASTGILSRILPGATPRSLAELIHREAGVPCRWLRRLAVIGGENPLETLRLSRQENTTFLQISDAISSGRSPAVLGHLLGVDTATDALLARVSVLGGTLPADWQRDVARGAASVLPVSAKDLMPHLSGPALGRRLRQIEQRWLDSDLHVTKAELLNGNKVRD